MLDQEAMQIVRNRLQAETLRRHYTFQAELQRVQNISSTSVRPSSAAPARKDGRTTSAAP